MAKQRKLVISPQDLLFLPFSVARNGESVFNSGRYNHMLQEPDIENLERVVDYLAGNHLDVYLSGSVVRNWNDKGNHQYKNIGLVATNDSLVGLSRAGNTIYSDAKLFQPAIRNPDSEKDEGTISINGLEFKFKNQTASQEALALLTDPKRFYTKFSLSPLNRIGSPIDVSLVVGPIE